MKCILEKKHLLPNLKPQIFMNPFCCLISGVCPILLGNNNHLFEAILLSTVLKFTMNHSLNNLLLKIEIHPSPFTKKKHPKPHTEPEAPPDIPGLRFQSSAPQPQTKTAGIPWPTLRHAHQPFGLRKDEQTTAILAGWKSNDPRSSDKWGEITP